MAVMWNALLAAPTFQDGFQQGQDRVRANFERDREMQFREEQAAALADERRSQQAVRDLEAHRDRIEIGGALFQGVQDQAGYDAALARARQFGVDLSDVPPVFDPAYVSGVIQSAEFLRQRGQQGQAPLREERLLDAAGITDPNERRAVMGDVVTNMREGSPFQFDVTGDGVPDIVPRSEYRRIIGSGGQPGQAAAPQQQEQTAVNPQTGQRLRLNPQTNQWEPIEGGPSPAAGSGGFPY